MGARFSQFIDYQTDDVLDSNLKFDLIFDTFGHLTFGEARKLLTAKGLFLPLNYSLGTALLNLLLGWTSRQKMITSVNRDTKEDLLALLDLLKNKKLKPVIDTVYPFTEFLQAHHHVEGRRKKGAIILDVATKMLTPTA